MNIVYTSFHLDNSSLAMRLYYIENEDPTNARTRATDEFLQNPLPPLAPPTTTPGSSNSDESSVQGDFRSRVLNRHKNVDRLHCTFCLRDASALGGKKHLHAAHMLEVHNKFLLCPKGAQGKYGIAGVNDTSNGMLLCEACHTSFDKRRLTRNESGKLSASSTFLLDDCSRHILDHVGAVIGVGDDPLSPSAALWTYREECFRKNVADRRALRALPFRCSHCPKGYTHQGYLSRHMETKHPDELAAALEDQEVEEVEEMAPVRPTKRARQLQAVLEKREQEEEEKEEEEEEEVAPAKAAPRARNTKAAAQGACRR
jgi:hypothetical protein